MNRGALANLPSVLFATKNAAEVEQEVIGLYERASGRTLAPGDPVRLFLLTLVAIIAQQRAIIDFAGKQNLLAYAQGDYLDHLGALVGTCRIPPARARAVVRFSLSAAQPQPVSIPKGARVSAGETYFVTVSQTVVLPGRMSADVLAECTIEGSAGNGYLPGQISKMVDPISYISGVVNVSTSTGGAEEESDESFRDRIQQAPERFSTAGPVGAYKYWAKSALQDISDVSVGSPEPGIVAIYPLMKGGDLPSGDVLSEVESICSADTVRPLTDTVRVLPPEAVEYGLNMVYWVARRDATMVSQIQQNVAVAVEDFLSWQRGALGRDINPSELIARVQGAGALRCEVRDPPHRSLSYSQIAREVSVNVEYGGFEDG